MSEQQHHDVVIVGGGSAGICVAARLTKGWRNKTDVAIIEPSDRHYYQPAWTLVGAGAYSLEKTRRPEASVIPKKAKWIQDAVTEFHPEENSLLTRDGKKISYNWLVVAAGIQINWDGIKGLQDAIGHDGVCSNYSFDYVSSTWESIHNFRGGNAIFTQPGTPIKCGGAPQKICYLADDYFRKSRVRGKTNVIFASAKDAIFDVEKYRKTLEKVIERKEIDARFLHDLTEIRAESKEAVFQNLATGEEVVLPYEMIHVTPPMSAPNFIAQSSLADAGGWVDVDKHTLQHTRFGNVFSLGDCSNLPTSKTAAAIRKQAPVVAKNLQALMRSQTMAGAYKGYTSCPVVTGYGRLVLAEFDYDKEPDETFPFDQSKERRSTYWMKKYLLPVLYWHGMLKGRA